MQTLNKRTRWKPNNTNTIQMTLRLHTNTSSFTANNHTGARFLFSFSDNSIQTAFQATQVHQNQTTRVETDGQERRLWATSGVILPLRCQTR